MEALKTQPITKDSADMNPLNNANTCPTRANIAVYLEDDGPSSDIPPFISTTNSYVMFGMREDETVLEAMNRHKAQG